MYEYSHFSVEQKDCTIPVDKRRKKLLKQNLQLNVVYRNNSYRKAIRTHHSATGHKYQLLNHYIKSNLCGSDSC